jgi:Fic family protein
MSDHPAWPAHGHLTVPWQMSGRGPREDRLLREITVSVPPFIAELDLRVSGPTETIMVDATAAVAALDAGPGRYLSGLGSFLLRTESVASSRIERVNSSRNDFAKAVAGIRSSADGRATLAAVTALDAMVRDAGTSGRVELSAVLRAHRLLLENDWSEKDFAGRLRTVQNWIGGSDHSPRGAIHVPPPAGLVPELMADLLRYADRTDLPAITQAAITHAQFESIHPFTDGNGRIGRALISAVLRRRGLTASTVVPVAAAMLADSGRYFAAVNDYRNGAADEFVAYLSEMTLSAAEAAMATADELSRLPENWRVAAQPRSGSTDYALLAELLAHPVVTVNDVVRLTGASFRAASDACERLTTAGVLEPLTGGARNRAWIAADVLAEIDALHQRIGLRGSPPG